MHVNYTMMGLGLTGGVRVQLEVGDRLVQRGHQVTYTYAGRRDDHAWFPVRAKLNYVDHSGMLKVFQNMEKRLPNARTHPWRELDLLGHAIPDCDINVAGEALTTYPVRWSGKGVQVAYHQHYEAVLPRDAYVKRQMADSYRLPMKRIANSSWLAEQLRAEHGITGLPLIFPAIDHNVFRERKVERPAKPRVVSFCKLVDWKGFADAAAAMKLVKKEMDVEFVAYGMDKPPEGSVDRWVHKPSDKDLADLYASATVVLCPSWFESFPLPPIEAMAVGTSVVTTKDGTEDYAHHEKNALVVPPRDVNAMAAAVLRLLKDASLREAFARAGPATAKTFTWERTTDQVEAFFKSLL